MPTAEDLELLKAYPWPGNVRELATVIDRAAILGDGKGLDIAHALGIAVNPKLQSADGAAAKPAQAAVPARGVTPLDAAMSCHIETALAATSGRIEGPHGAAWLPIINPHTLRARASWGSIGSSFAKRSQNSSCLEL